MSAPARGSLTGVTPANYDYSLFDGQSLFCGLARATWDLQLFMSYDGLLQPVACIIWRNELQWLPNVTVPDPAGILAAAAVGAGLIRSFTDRFRIDTVVILKNSYV
jgi:hypothetical protein